MANLRGIVAVLGVALVACLAVRAQSPSPATKTVDTGVGFSISVPETWTKGQPIKNNRFVMGSDADDFAVMVSDFGPAQTDAAQALAVYRESFTKNGLVPETESDLTVGGKSVKRFVLRFDTPDGPGHAEAVLVPVADEMFAVLVVTPAATADARRPTIAKIFESITFDKGVADAPPKGTKP